MNGSYIRRRSQENKSWGDLIEVLYGICELSCIILIIYFCWYVEAFGNWGIIVNGSFLIMSGSIIVIWLIEGEIQIKKLPFGIWGQLFTIIYCFLTGIIVAYSQSTLFSALRQYLIYIVISYAICFISMHKESYDWLLNTVIVSTIICCIHLAFFGYHYSANRIVLSFNSNPNVLATILNVGLFSVLLNSKRSLKWSLLQIVFALTIIYFIVGTGSRKNFISSSILLLTFAYSKYVSTMRGESLGGKRKFFMVLAISIVAIYLIYHRFFVNTELFSRLQNMDNEDSNRTRIKLYKAALSIFLDKPFLGGGLDQFRYWSGRGGYAHSTYAEAIADLGFLGCVLYFTPFIYTITEACRKLVDNSDLFVTRMVVGFCIVELFIGIGQIWFMEVCHFIAWAIIFTVLALTIEKRTDVETHDVRYSKYVRY